MAYTWLPGLMRRNEFSTEQEYCDAMHAVFHRDFIATKQSYAGLPINIKRLPHYGGLYEGKESTFRHLITSGDDEATRQLVADRCERIGWMLPLLQRVGTADVKAWENKRVRSGAAHILALSDFSYKLVLVQRKDYLLLWTQVPHQYGHERQSLRKEYERLKTN